MFVFEIRVCSGVRGYLSFFRASLGVGFVEVLIEGRRDVVRFEIIVLFLVVSGREMFFIGYY